MGRKSEEREKRKALQQQRFEANKQNFVAKVGDLSGPKVLAEPQQKKVPRLAPHLERAAEVEAAKPKTIVDGSRFGAMVTWCDTKKDHDGHWSWHEPRAWTPEEWAGSIYPVFTNFAKLTWGEIDALASESGHKMHHDHELSDLIEEAQDRWRALGLEQFDTLFRFRLGGTKRAWGFIAQAHFHLVWWDRNHSLYPV